MWSQTTQFKPRAIALACAALLAGCGGGGGGSSDGGLYQAVTMNYPGGQSVAVPPAVATTKLVATASGGGPVTFSSSTPDVCSVNGDTLSLLKAGECSVTASQAGGNGYAPASTRQLFVIPKIRNAVLFLNPGRQPLDSTPLQLSAMSIIAGKPVTYESSTPNVCTVSGNTLTKLANGICTVTAMQAGDDIYASAKAVRNIPIGDAAVPPLTFLSGYKDGSTTNESGKVDLGAGASDNGWWCNGKCTTTVAENGSSLAFSFDYPLDTPNSVQAYYGITLYGPGMSAVPKTIFVLNGIQVEAQSVLKLNFAQNPEWFSTGQNKVNVTMTTGYYVPMPDGTDDKGNPKTKDCNVQLKAVVTPTAAAATDYSIDLKNGFTVSNACGLTGLDTWSVLQTSVIASIKLEADTTNLSVSTPGAPKPTYETKLTLNGPITFQ